MVSNVRLPSVFGGETYFPIGAVIRGPELNQLADISKQVADLMRKYPELVDVNPSLNLNTPELQVKVDRQRAADIGVRMSDVKRRRPPLLFRRRRDHPLQRRLRAISGHYAVA